jgi:hypothetical protein
MVHGQRRPRWQASHYAAGILAAIFLAEMVFVTVTPPWAWMVSLPCYLGLVFVGGVWMSRHQSDACARCLPYRRGAWRRFPARRRARVDRQLRRIHWSPAIFVAGAALACLSWLVLPGPRLGRIVGDVIVTAVVLYLFALAHVHIVLAKGSCPRCWRRAQNRNARAWRDNPPSWLIATVAPPPRKDTTDGH